MSLEHGEDLKTKTKNKKTVTKLGVKFKFSLIQSLYIKKLMNISTNTLIIVRRKESIIPRSWTLPLKVNKPSGISSSN